MTSNEVERQQFEIWLKHPTTLRRTNKLRNEIEKMLDAACNVSQVNDAGRAQALLLLTNAATAKNVLASITTF